MRNLVSILTLMLFCTLSSLSAKIEIKCPPDLDLGCIKSKSEIPKPNPEGVKVESDCRELKVRHVGDRLFEEGCKTRIERYYEATNGCKEEISCRQIIWYVYDVVAPVFLNCDVQIDLGCNPDLNRLLPEIDADEIKAEDNCGIEKIILISEELKNDGCQFYSIRRYRAYDYCGNSTECKKVYSWTVDKQKPTVLKGPEDLYLGCNPKSIRFPKYDKSHFKIEDACSETTVDIKEIFWDTTDCEKSRCTVYNIVDQCGNRSEFKHCVAWCVDIEAPNISCPKPLLLGCNPQSIPETDISKIIAWDNCGKPLHIYVTSSSISVEDCLYKLYRTYTVEDQAGNKNSCDEIFLWYESEGIHFAECPEDFDMGVLNEAPEYFPDFTIGLETEGCSLDSSWYFDSEVVTEGCYSEVVRTWYIADVCGFRDSCQQTFSWILDIDGISCPEDLHFPCTAKWDDMLPRYEVGEIIKHNECADATLVFANYALDPLIFIDQCIGEYLLFYYLIEEGDTTMCTQAITWDLSLGDCSCIDDITTLPPRDLCPEDRYISCDVDYWAPFAFESYRSGQFVSANTKGEGLYFASKEVEESDCLEIWYIHYHMIDAAGNETHCTQMITIEIESDTCPCIDDLTPNPGGTICPDNKHFPCNTSSDELFPYEEGQWLDSTASGTQLIFDQYGFDILNWGCTFTRTAHYFLIDSDGDTTRCSSSISWDKATSDCGCIDDYTIDTGLCPEDLHFPCGTSEEVMFPYEPDEWIASDGAGSNLYFNYYGPDTIGECYGRGSAHYYIVSADGLLFACEQLLTRDMGWHADCPCIDDLTTIGHRMPYEKEPSEEMIPHDIWLEHRKPLQGNNPNQNADLYQIYPNPALRDFTLEMKSNTGPIIDIEVRDVQGRILHSWTGDDQKEGPIKINSQSWPAGIYLVTVSTDTGIQTKRLVKQ